MGRRLSFVLASAALTAACSLADLGYLRDPTCAPDCGAPPIADASPSDAVDAPSCDGAYRAVVACDAPIAYFRLGEPGAPSAFDEVDGGPLGSFVERGDGGITYGVPGAIAGDPDTAIHLGGEAEVNAGTALSFDANAPYSFEAWVTTDVIDTAYRRILERAIPGPTAVEDGYLLLNQINGLTSQRSADAMAVSATGPGIGSGTVYTHVVTTYDGKELVLYVDGVGTTPIAAPISLRSVEASFRIGNSSGAGGGWIGNIDEVAVYAHALSAARVSAHYRAGRGL